MHVALTQLNYSYFVSLFVATCFAQTPQPALIPDAPPVMLRIADAESGSQQFNDDGTVVSHKNTDGTIDRGIFQINSSHQKDAERMGYDIMTADGNIKYALYLYKIQGTRPWSASKPVWSKVVPTD